MERQFKAIGYVRVASAEISAETSGGNGIENQRNKIEDFVSEREDLQLVKIFSDHGVSGLELERNGLNELINYIHKNKIDCVIVCDVLRIGRKMVDVENFIRNNFTKENILLIALN